MSSGSLRNPAEGASVAATQTAATAAAAAAAAGFGFGFGFDLPSLEPGRADSSSSARGLAGAGRDEPPAFNLSAPTSEPGRDAASGCDSSARAQHKATGFDSSARRGDPFGFVFASAPAPAPAPARGSAFGHARPRSSLCSVGYTSLLDAIRRGDVEEVAQSDKLKLADREEWVAALESKVAGMASAIVRRCRSSRIRDALHLAAGCGRADLCDMLLVGEGEFEVSARDTRGNTPLHIAARYGRRKVCGLLLDRGASVDAPRKDGWTPLHIAVRSDRRKVCELLLDRGASVHAPAKFGTTPLSVAVEKGHRKVCELLLDRGASVDAPRTDGETPLSIAAEKGHKEVCGLLMDRGASVHAPAKFGATPLHFAAEKGHKEVCELLLDRGAAIDAPNKDAATPLWIAARNGRKKVCEMLLDRGSSVNARTSTDCTPLFIAACCGHNEVCELLLDRGATHAPDRDGETPLFIASQFFHADVCELLLDRGAVEEPRSRWTRVLERAGPDLRCVLAQRIPGLFRDLPPSRTPRTVFDLIVWVQTWQQELPRADALARVPQVLEPEVEEIVAVLRPDTAERRGEAWARGRAVRRAWRGEDVGCERLPPRAWRVVLMAAYGVPEAWLGSEYWRQPAHAISDPIRLARHAWDSFFRFERK